MSDSRVRELEATWRTSGAVEDEAAWLQERVRVGDLEQSKLELAAYCGHSGAARSATPLSLEEGEAWLEGLVGYGRIATVRSLIAIAVVSLEAWTRDETCPIEAAHAAQDWILCPCDPHRAAAGLAAGRCEDLYTQAGSFGASEIAACAAKATYETDLASLIRYSVWWGTKRLCESFDDLLEENDLLLAVRADLVPWALGYSDPVRERVEVRARASEHSERD